jgi:molybdenum cofactor cytidylyltransferase
MAILAHDRAMIPAVVLAAGKSTRMGQTKALLPLGGETFVSRIVATFRSAGVEDVVVVVGHDAERVAEALGGMNAPPRVIMNPDYETGQLSSILSGLRAVDRPGVTAMLMTLVDVPLVSADTVRAVLMRYRSTSAPVVRPVNGDRHGHPVLLDRTLFSLIRGADPAAGAKPIVRAHASAEGDVEVSDEGAFTDIDTPDEYASATARF